MLKCSSGAAQLSPDLAGLAWIQYMRWARRADSVNASRKLFVKARKWPQCSWQVRSMHSVTFLALSSDKDCCRAAPTCLSCEASVWQRHLV